ncbi:MAG TPA: PD-(D/E)XK nuclease family protein [Acidimicrobiales bacterium]|nr:PD-(D/E)XK nuclease family protein [Acidimicrobiales bacterium]
MSPPRTLSPSKVAAFTQCALKFRYTAIDKLPEPPSEAATKGTLVHAALERLFTLDPEERTGEAAQACLDQAIEWIRLHDEFTDLELDEVTEKAFFSDAAVLVDNYLAMEDPTTIRPIGIEVMLEVPRSGYALRGIIDRLELGPDGELIVTDYKTGRAPPERFAQRRMDGVKLYASMCTDLLGRRPDKVQLLFLRDRAVIEAAPTTQELTGMNRRVDAIWHAVERSCATDDFRPKPSKLCDWCSFKPHCPAFGGDALAPPLATVQA